MLIWIGYEGRTKATKHARLLDVIGAIRDLDKLAPGNYRSLVVIDSIRKFNHAVPFVPYEIHTASGETYEIPHPDFILVSPRGSYVVVIDPKDPREAPNHISALLIERASLLDGHKRRKRRRRS